MPVFAVSMNVRTRAGHAVTLVARDAAGNVLGEVISPPASNSQDFFPMQIASAVPIASLEWFAPQGRDLYIDQIFVTVPEPAGLGIPTLVALALLRRRFAERL